MIIIRLVIHPQKRTSVDFAAFPPGKRGMGRVQRRDFLLTAGALLAVPLAAETQQAAKVIRIGILAGNRAASPHTLEAFLQGLRDLGYVEGRNVVIEFRDAEGKPERLPALAGELLALKVDVTQRQHACLQYGGDWSDWCAQDHEKANATGAWRSRFTTISRHDTRAR
jgi:hypothetical protein